MDEDEEEDEGEQEENDDDLLSTDDEGDKPGFYQPRANLSRTEPNWAELRNWPEPT